MVIQPGPELESVLKQQAKRRGIAPEAMAIGALEERFLAQVPPIPRDEWDRGLPAATRKCGVSLPNSALSSDTQNGVATNAVLELHGRGETLHITPQVMIEFRKVATRPVPVNGLEHSIDEAEALTDGGRESGS